MSVLHSGHGTALTCPMMIVLPYGVQDLPADLHWLGIDKRKSHYTRRSAAVDPIVERPALYEDVARFQVNDRVVKLHVDLTRHDDGIIDRIRPVVPPRHTGRKLDDAKNRSVVQCRTDLS